MMMTPKKTILKKELLGLVYSSKLIFFFSLWGWTRLDFLYTMACFLETTFVWSWFSTAKKPNL